MLSKNFFYRVKYQINHNAIPTVFFQFFLDRIKHPFVQSIKKKLKHDHQNYLRLKKHTTDYFSLNAYYWNTIINKNFKEFSYLEIGSWEGNSTSYILRNFETKKVFCVDIWDKDENINRVEQKKLFDNFKLNLTEFKERFKFFKDTSDNFFANNNEKFDIIYIDGSHEAFQVYKDINNSWNSLNINGLIICDDYFYGDIRSGNDSNRPANAINRFLFERKNNLKVICVNNTQIFIKKLSN